MLARAVTRRLDRLDNRFDRRFVPGQPRRKSPFVADRGGQAAIDKQLLERVEHLRSTAQCLPESGQADRHDHEFLHVKAVVGVRTAVDHVHHRHRH